MQAQSSPPVPFPESLSYSDGMAKKITKTRPRQGAHLAQLRKEAGLSQLELGRLIGETQQNIAFWEQSDKPPRSDVLVKMAKVLGVKVSTILNANGDRERTGGPIGKVQKIFEEVNKLPKSQQNKIVEVVEAFVWQKKAG